MRKIVVSEFMSLDGVVEAPEKWHFPYITDDMMAVTQEQINSLDVMLMGRNTYNDHAGFWPTQTNNEFGIAAKLNSAPKFVVSSTLDKADWNNTTIIRGNVIEEITRLKQQGDGTIGIDGSVTLIQALIEADLVDEYHLMIHPIVIGQGKRLFSEGLNTTKLKLVDTKTFSGGVVLLVYQRDRSQ